MTDCQKQQQAILKILNISDKKMQKMTELYVGGGQYFISVKDRQE